MKMRVGVRSLRLAAAAGHHHVLDIGQFGQSRRRAGNGRARCRRQSFPSAAPFHGRCRAPVRDHREWLPPASSMVVRISTSSMSAIAASSSSFTSSRSIGTSLVPLRRQCRGDLAQGDMRDIGVNSLAQQAGVARSNDNLHSRDRRRCGVYQTRKRFSQRRAGA